MQHVGRRQLLDLKTSNQSYLVLNKSSLSLFSSFALLTNKLVMGKWCISLIRLNVTYKFALITLGNCKCKVYRLQKLLHRLEQHGL
jgi:hypothetical protein